MNKIPNNLVWWLFVGIFHPTKKIPRFPTRDYFGIFPGFFRDFQIPIPIPRIPRFSGFCAQNFFGIFSRFSNPNPDPRDSGIFGILRSGFFGNFSRVSNPDPREFLGFFTRDFFQNFGIFGIFRSSPKLKIPIPNLEYII